MLLKIALGMFVIAATAAALIWTGVLQGGPCGTGPGWDALGVIILTLPVACISAVAHGIRWAWRRTQTKENVTDGLQ